MFVTFADNQLRPESRRWHAHDNLLAVGVARWRAPALLVDHTASYTGQRHLPGRVCQPVERHGE
jgi:hypothetical protein